MKYKTIIFDLDGTLLNTLNDIANAANRVLLTHGFPIHSADEYRYFIGDGAMTLMQRAMPEDKKSQNIVRICHRDFIYDYSRNWKIKTHLYDGIAKMLDALCTRGIRMSILSNKPHESTLKCVHAYLNQWPFEAIFGQQDSIPAKPDPAGALLIAGQMGVSPSEFLYLGDTAVDMKTACTAGMHAIGALWGFRTKEELITNGARAVLNHPMELLSLLD